MACDTQPVTQKQTLTERKLQVREAIAKLATLVAAGKVKPVIGPQGAITFAGWTNEDRSYVSDACALRLVMISGNAIARAKIAQAQQLSGRAVNTHAGVHSHDGGHSWHHNH